MNRSKQTGWATWRYEMQGFWVFVNGHPYQEYAEQGEATAFARGWNQCKRHIDAAQSSVPGDTLADVPRYPQSDSHPPAGPLGWRDGY